MAASITILFIGSNPPSGLVGLSKSDPSWRGFGGQTTPKPARRENRRDKEDGSTLRRVHFDPVISQPWDGAGLSDPVGAAARALARPRPRPATGRGRTRGADARACSPRAPGR